MFTIVDIHDEIIIVVTLDGRFRPKEVGLVVWVDGRPARGARIFLSQMPLSLGGGAVQAIPKRDPFVCVGK